MTQPTPRRWFHFHFMTAVVVMFAAAAIIPSELSTHARLLDVAVVLVVLLAVALVSETILRCTVTVPPPTGRWFQFHLLTLVLMALVAGGALALNAIPSHDEVDGGGSHRDYINDLYGWPLTFRQRTGLDGEIVEFAPVNAAFDLALAVALVMATAFVSEAIIRRGESWHQGQ